MSEQENIEIVKTIYSDFGEGNIAGMLSVFADDPMTSSLYNQQQDRHRSRGLIADPTKLARGLASWWN